MAHHLQKGYRKKFVGAWKIFFYLLSASLLLLWPAFWNGYPLVFSDTGTYIFSAFLLKVPIDRPIGYGYFLRFFSGGISLWFVVYAQAFLTSYLLWKMIRIFLDKKRFLAHLSLMAGLSFFTALPWFVSQVMPDIFPGLIFLVIFVFLFGENSLFERVLLVVCLMLFLVTHSANFLLGLSLLAPVALYFLLRKKRLAERLVYLQRTAFLAVVCLFAPGFFLFTNYHEGYGFVLSPSSHVFMMSRVNDSGILDDFLKQNCSKVHYFLCDYAGNFPKNDGFIWNKDSPVNIVGWENAKTEYQNILREIFIQPGYLVRFAGDSMVRLAELFSMDGIDSFLAYGKNGPVYPQIEKYFSAELNSYVNARQYRGEFVAIDWMSGYFFVVLFLSLAWIFRCMYQKTLLPFEKALSYSVVLFLVINAGIMATLSGAYGRYQERLTWLVPLAVLLVVLRRRFQSANFSK